METRRLYYEDPHLYQFTAKVLSCQAKASRWEIILDATAFYPEGGGQAADTGVLGSVRVLDTRERENTVVHLCDGPLPVGESFSGLVDEGPRFHRMQQHSGEHIVSGLLHRRYGCHNVGFHMGSDVMTVDFDCVIPAQALPELEAEANRIVWQNLPIRCYYPEPQELAALPYRTKRALPWPVRIVEIPGIDLCACCGVHVERTAEIGLIKLLSAIPFRGGTRMEMACGAQALELLNAAYGQNKLVSQAFSVPIRETGAAAQRMNEQLAEQAYKSVGLRRRIFSFLAADCAGRGDTLLFEPELSGGELRELADTLAHSCAGVAAVFSGSDEQGYAFCIAALSGDLRPLCSELTAKLQGRGGGKPNFQQGRVSASRQSIETFFSAFHVLGSPNTGNTGL